MESSKKTNLKNVLYIGTLSFFGGIGQDMFLPILPIYLTTVLGFNKEFIGLTEGLVLCFASIFKIIAGYLSDKISSRKSIIFVGYFCSMIGRALLAIFTGGTAILVLRTADGIGKGVKDAPKDALIGESTEGGGRGRAFGIVRSLDTFGSVAGPIILFVALFLLRDNPQKYEYILLGTMVPLAITLLIITLKVKEVSKVGIKSSKSIKNKLPMKFYYLLAIIGFFTLGNSSDAFLILRATNVGVTILTIPLVIAVFNFFYASASIPLGSLSDRIGREKVIMLGWGAYALAYFGFGLANKSYHIWLLYMLYGLYYATTEGVIKALVADTVPESHRGRAFGLLNATIGILAVPANILAGVFWEHVSPSMPFYFGAIIGLVSIIFIGLLRPKKYTLDFQSI